MTRFRLMVFGLTALAGFAAGGLSAPLLAHAAEEAPSQGPTVMLCLYGTDGRIRAGHADCPAQARPADAMLAEAHCFYDADGQLWRGLPRCPREAPAFLLDEAAGASE